MKRVYDLENELNIPRKELLELLKELGAKVRSPMSTVPESIEAKLRDKITAVADEKEKQKEVEKEKRLAEKALRSKKEKEKKERQRKKKEKKERPAAEEPKVQSEKPVTPELEESSERDKPSRKKRPKQAKGTKEEEAALSAKRKKDRSSKYKVAVVTEDQEDKPVPRRPKKKKPREKKEERDQKAVQEMIRQTMAKSETGRRVKKYRKKVKEQEEVVLEGRPTIRISEFNSVAELANMLNVSPAQLISTCMQQLGMMVTINQRLDHETIEMVADEFGYDVELIDALSDDLIEEDDEDNVQQHDRAPVVTIMGHVDHGKTSLLDYIRKSNIIASESGGITQHIGAYSIIANDKKITFIDTPGHEAFTNMRARGAQATDIVVLVIATDDRVMPQTIEAIDHAKAAKVPIIVALNKIDLPTADPERIRADLAQRGLIVEQYGGDIISIEISAKKGTGVDKLLDMILLQAEILELKAGYNQKARGVVLEAELDKGRGPVATVLVQQGTLSVGDSFVAGEFSGKVRAMFDDLGKKIDAVLPSTPVEVLGFDGVPHAGDTFRVVKDERMARQISSERQLIKREREFNRRSQITLENLYSYIQAGEIKDLNIILKADMVGSVEALSDALQRLSTDEVSLKIIHQGIGGITENDVNLASASKAIIIAFHVVASSSVREMAEQQNVEIRRYKVIFEAVDDLRKALEGMLKPESREKIIGQAAIRAVISVPKVGNIAGSYVKEGTIQRNARVRVIRDGIIIHEGTVSSLKRFKDDVREVQTGFECGIGLEGFNDVRENDILEFFVIEEIRRTL